MLILSSGMYTLTMRLSAWREGEKGGGRMGEGEIERGRESGRMEARENNRKHIVRETERGR
jgi:hypothetical protein